MTHTHAAHHVLHRYFMSQVHKNSVMAKTVPMDTYIYKSERGSIMAKTVPILKSLSNN